MDWQRRTRFNEAWEAIFASKFSNKTSLSHQEYQDRLKKVRRLIDKKSYKKSRLLRNYDIVIKDGRERLVKPLPQKGVASDQYPLYVTNEELFDVLREAHIDTYAGGVDMMYKHIRGRYCNVTKEAIRTYLKLRYPVEARAISPEVEQGLLPVPPSYLSGVNGITSVCFGFVDMHRYARDGYTCIMVHWDTSTWFTHMVPLQSMDHVHVAVSLLEIYAKVGIPNCIDAPYDRQYISSVINHIQLLLPGEDYCITMRSSDDQDAIIRGLNTVQEIMAPWMNDANFQRNWPSKLKYIQTITNKNNFSGSALPILHISHLDFCPSV
eukprot:XP_016664288.1 PREDICTED: KRAB-A domain-containing protein 2-like [Acyrthosiphon pisum]